VSGPTDNLVTEVAKLLYGQEIDALPDAMRRTWDELSPVHQARYEQRAVEVAIAIVNEINSWKRPA
jgi:hypothetical protein